MDLTCASKFMDSESPQASPVDQALPLHARVAVLEAVIAVSDFKIVFGRLASCLEEAMREVDDSTPKELRAKLEEMRVKLLQHDALSRRQSSQPASPLGENARSSALF